MRTTLTLDPDVALTLKQEMERENKTLKATMNDALRRGLSLVSQANEDEPFKVEARDFGFKAGVDLDRINQLVDQL
ncbi:MAG: antitoxin, partial [Candidatus Eremiobacteraeota bacterium]|nr:antitoxin [Candidatus Eremiobacteraeota bacterium]